MLGNFLRNNVYAAALVTVIRVYVGWQWMTAGFHKITEDFSAAGFIKGAIGKASAENPTVQGWWASFLEEMALPNAGLFSFLVAWGELLVGIGLILGLFTGFAALMGATMNAAFLLSGTLSTNPNMLTLTIVILVAASNAGRFGLDPYVVPYLKTNIAKLLKKDNKNNTSTPKRPLTTH